MTHYALLINPKHYATGLNLEFIDCIIIYHNMDE